MKSTELNYEYHCKTLQEYRLTYRVFDDKFANTATVIIKVTDVNDNPPRFDPAEYVVEDIVEEDPFVSDDNPKFLIRVRDTKQNPAPPPQKNQNNLIIYSMYAF